MYASTEYHGRTVTPHSMRKFIFNDRRETRSRTGASLPAETKITTPRSALGVREPRAKVTLAEGQKTWV